MSFKEYTINNKILNEEESPIYRDERYKISVYDEPLRNPTFHVTYKTEWEVVLQIKDFKILEVKFGDFKKGTQLPIKILKDIKEILNKKNKTRKDISNWELLIIMWNLNNPKTEINKNLKMM